MRRSWMLAAVLGGLWMGCGSSDPEPGGGLGAGGTVDEFDEKETATPPSSLGLIGDAREAGELSAAAAAHYELLATHMPSLLPAAFQAEEPLYGAPSVSAALVAASHLDDYPPDVRKEVEAMLKDPEDPDWLRFDRLSNFIPSGKSCWELFAVTPDSVSGRYIGPFVDTKYFRIRGLLPVAGEVQRQDELASRLEAALAARVPGVGGKGEVKLTDYFDQSFEYFRDTLGMKDPRTLPLPQRNKGQDGEPRIPIYITTCDGGLNSASASAEGFVITSVEIALEDPDLRRVVMPHEIFHLFEYAYGYCGDDHDCWPYEAAATAIEDEVAPGVRRWSGRFASKPYGPKGLLDPLERSFRCPEEPIHSSFNGPCRNRAGAKQNRYGGNYSKFVLFKYLMRNHGLKMKDFWQAYAAAGSDPSKVLEEEHLGAFQLALLADPPERGAFDPEDRAWFRQGSHGKEPLDADPRGVARYTFRVDASRIKALGPAFRVTPTDTASRAVLEKGDSRNLPVAPGGTHRILIEVPKEAGVTTEISGGNIHVALKGAASPKVAFNYVALDDSGKGPSTTHRGSDDYGDASSYPIDSGVQFERGRTFYTEDHGALPKYILATVTNFGPAEFTYQLGVSFAQACSTACTDYFAKELVRMGCDKEWCDWDNPEECLRWYREEGARDLVAWDWGVCGFICSVSRSPYHPSMEGDEWLEAICSGASGACIEDPSAYIPIPKWPKFQCEMIHY